MNQWSKYGLYMSSPTLQVKGKDVHSEAQILSREDKIEYIREHFAAILEILGLDLENESLRSTPERVAKMYVDELFSGLDPYNKPQLSLFQNDYGYDQILVEKDISFHSICEHHFLPIIGRAHVGYIPKRKVIGLSKINRLVSYYASRPQVQERLTVQILEAMRLALDTQDVAVWLQATHLCVTSRGIKDRASTTITTKYSGEFLEEGRRKEFIDHLHQQAATAV